LIRVPENLAKQLNEIAHRLDAGEVIDLDTKPIREENERLKREVGLLNQQLTQSSEEINRLKTEKNSQPSQLELFSISPTPALPPKEVLVKIRDRCLRLLSTGKQSKQYTQTKYAFDEFIAILLSGKY
jgi:HAMP domain-containing protein